MVFDSLNFNEIKKAIKPIIQGGMAIRVSRAPLAAAVANCGGVGIIAASGMEEVELREQIRLARELQTNKDGLIAVNIMFAATEFNALVNISIEEGIDLIIFGAGFSRDIFSIGKEANVPIIPIVSSPKLAVLAKKLGASGIIAESGEAGGHLGTKDSIFKIIPEIKEALASIPGRIPLIAAGGITNGYDIAKILKLGADGVQMATRFILSKECDAHDNFKNMILNANLSDLAIIQSPVGLAARAVLNDFTKKVLNDTQPRPTSCDKCLKKCSHSFCIIKALDSARLGDIKNGLIFAGENIGKYKDILPVKDIFAKLEQQAKEYFEAKQPEMIQL